MLSILNEIFKDEHSTEDSTAELPTRVLGVLTNYLRPSGS